MHTNYCCCNSVEGHLNQENSIWVEEDREREKEREREDKAHMSVFIGGLAIKIERERE